MSFEGYYQCLCASGHLTMFDMYGTTAVEFRTCQHKGCGADIIHRNIVADADGTEHGKIDFVLVRENKCSCCEQITERIYKLP